MLLLSSCKVSFATPVIHHCRVDSHIFALEERVKGRDVGVHGITVFDQIYLGISGK